MITGHLDSITSTGFAEGWASDEDAPTRPVKIAVADQSGSICATAYAHLYRPDLAEAGIGTGWNAFRARLSIPIPVAMTQRLHLIEAETGAFIHRPETVAYREESDMFFATVAECLAADPTSIATIEQLDGCIDVFDGFIAAQGVEAFIRTAYAYILGRPADYGGLEAYSQKLRDAELVPLELLRILACSDEFRLRNARLPAPHSPAFPFFGA